MAYASACYLTSHDQKRDDSTARLEFESNRLSWSGPNNQYKIVTLSFCVAVLGQTFNVFYWTS